jgi:cobalt-zinc-cadmium efflux system membrane fusion protein
MQTTRTREQSSDHGSADDRAGVSTTETSGPELGTHERRMSIGQRIVLVLLLLMLVVPPTAAFYSYFSGVPLHLLASTKTEDRERRSVSALPALSLAAGKAHTALVPEEVCAALGIKKNNQVRVAVAQPPTAMRPLVLPGSTALDPTRLARIRPRFAPVRVVELAKVPDWATRETSGHTDMREIRQGDVVSKGDYLGTFYSLDVGAKKNDLLDALVQLQLDQQILDDAEKHREAVPPVLLNQYKHAVQTDRNAVNKALNNLKLWEIPQDEIDALHAEAQKLSEDRNAWYKTPEGRWVKGENLARRPSGSAETEAENPWGRVTFRAPFDGVVVERTVHTGEMVVDPTVNLFQIADVRRLLVTAHCPEDELPTLEGLHGTGRRWTVKTIGSGSASGLPGIIDQISYIIDPNQHTLEVQGYVENPGMHMRAGQFVTATVNIPPPKDVVEIPTVALVDDGLQSVVFVQPNPAANQFTMRRVQVTHRFERAVFVRSAPFAKDEQLTAREMEEGLLPREPLQPGDRVLLSGAVELKAAVQDLESRMERRPDDRGAKGKTTSEPAPPPETEKKNAGQG